jgi:hypothetical protein
MRARDKSKDRKDNNAEVALNIKNDGSRRSKRGKTTLDKALIAFRTLGIIIGVIVAFHAVSQIWKGAKARVEKATEKDSDESIMRRATVEVKRWAKTGELPTFGVTRGDYSHNGKFCHFCGGDLEWCVAHNQTNTTTPPVELLFPGRLVTRVLSEKAICFLWYSDSIFSRPSGGMNGIFVKRVGGVDR